MATPFGCLLFGQSIRCCSNFSMDTIYEDNRLSGQDRHVDGDGSGLAL